MCAINGFTFADEALARRMNARTSHRGPDGTGVFSEDGITLGHNRLSILDLSAAAAQPMTSTDGRFVIAFNGEIYNYRELRKELEDTYRFSTSSDTEVLLAAYARWGAESVKRLNGIFAYALWDRRRGELLLARDHNGVKPLYYALENGRLFFSSEIKALLDTGVPAQLDRFGFDAFLRVLYVPEPHTAFARVKKLPAAHYALFKDGRLEIARYWNVETKEERRPEADWRAEVARGVDAAVKRQLISDRPLGVYLSGGIDSSAVLDAVSRIRGNVDAFSVGYETRNRENDEKFNADFRLAQRTAAHYGARHHTMMLSADDVARLFEDAAYHADDLISNPTALAMFALARFTKPTADVILGGDGGDELFGGYPRHRLSLIASHWQRLPAPLRRAAARLDGRLAKLETPPDARRWTQFHFQKDKTVAALVADGQASKEPETFFQRAYFDARPAGVPFESWFLQVDRMSWLTDHSLALSDKMSMASGVEARVPLLDRELVELAARIPLAYKVDVRRTKKILKDAFRGRLPDELLRQPKRGWFSPGAKWLREPSFRKLAEELLSPGYYAPTSGLFAWDRIREMLAEHCDRGGYHLTPLWAVMTFQAWARRFNVTL